MIFLNNSVLLGFLNKAVIRRIIIINFLDVIFVLFQ